MKNSIAQCRDFDESLLEINLQKTIEKRIVTHDAALEVALEFKRAGQEFYETREK